MFILHLATLFVSVVAAVTVSASPVQDTATSEASEAVTPNLTALEKRATTPLTAAQKASYKPYTNFAAVAYCPPSTVRAWSCTKCKANPGFEPVAAGGDGATVQYWYVGYGTKLASVIVGFQGTDFSKMQVLPAVTDTDFFLTPLRPALFPGLSSNIKTHNGFGDAQAASAAPVLEAVKTAMSKYATSHVTIVGHSLGGAIATISAVHLKTNLPSTTTFRLITYGSPRVGNQAFVDYVNSHFPGAVARITNQDDIVPIVPGRFLGFAHVKGEIHILNDLSWVSCPGQDNTDPKCSIGYVPNIFAGDDGDHEGPYDGVLMSCS